MIIFLSIRSFVVFQNDILLEHVSEEKYIGRIRGALIVLASTAWGFGPLVSGYFIDYFSIEVVYWLGLVAALVPLFIFFFFFKKEENKKQNIHSIKKMYQELFKDRNLLYVFFISLGINIFYALSIIYIPLHLHSFIGFDWSEIGGLLLISQIPFIFFAYPIGKIADSYIGEQEIIITGVLISILSLIGMIFTKSSNFVAWALLLFISRVGMSFLDTGCETYFFKKIKKDDSEKIAVQRNTFPLSYLLISGIGIIIGIFTESYVPFFVIGIISFIIILYPAFKIEDTL
jgi:MFS family permease